jgi:hypothetical protein
MRHWQYLFETKTDRRCLDLVAGFNPSDDNLHEFDRIHIFLRISKPKFSNTLSIACRMRDREGSHRRTSRHLLNDIPGMSVRKHLKVKSNMAVNVTTSMSSLHVCLQFLHTGRALERQSRPSFKTSTASELRSIQFWRPLST